MDVDPGEVRARREKVAARLRERGLDGYVVFLEAYVSYLSGFTFIPTERPIVLVADLDGASLLVVPLLEERHALGSATVDEVLTYDEYPGVRHPMEVVVEVANDWGLGGAGRIVGVDTDGYPPLWGYAGPSLSEGVAARVELIAGVLDGIMMVKSPYEIARLEESSHWAGEAHRRLQDYTAPGLTETEVSLRASAEATAALIEALPHYEAGSASPGARAGYRGQIGRGGATPHALAANIRFAEGDTLVTGATAPMWGYVSELERTMFLGEPGPRQRELYAHMVDLQDACIDAIKPGRPASAVDEAMRDLFERRGLWPLWRHHVGHGIGRRYHEGPFLDRGEATILAPGMVLTVEPGLYDADWGGFRHSDTVLVTSDGIRWLTEYPRDLASLIIPTT